MASAGKTLNALDDTRMKEAFGAMEHPRDFRPFVPTEKALPELNSTRAERTVQVMEGAFYQEQRALFDTLIAEPYKGVTFDGTRRPVARRGYPAGAVRSKMEAAARALIDLMRPEISARVRFDMADEKSWRRWHNMPMLWPVDGVGLEEMNPAERKAVMDLMSASLSPEGYREMIELMEVNRFSGELIGREKYLNEFCYSVGLFGTPGDHTWGWQFYGHHLCLNIVLTGDSYVLGPTLLAAEPTVVDEGPMAGINAFISGETAALEMMRGLSPDLQARAQILSSILVADVPEGRRHWSDSLHLGGAFRDNRVMPAEGVCLKEAGSGDRALVMAFAETFHALWPDAPRAARLAEIEAYLDQTWLTWMGGYDDWAPFYVRLHSPALLAEYDCHQAVFLTNKEPARFHVHTLTRLPEGGDYAMDQRE